MSTNTPKRGRGRPPKTKNTATKTATEIIRNKKANVSEEQIETLKSTITNAIRDNSTGAMIKMDTKPL